MNRRDAQHFLAALVGMGSLAAAIPVAFALPPAGKTLRIGLLYLARDRFDPQADAVDRALLEGLGALGYEYGRNLQIEFRTAGGQVQRLPALAAEFVRLKVDMILVRVSNESVRAAREATSTIPIVMFGVPDPIANGFVASLARPGGNVTGLSVNAAEIAAKRIQLLKEAVPKLTTVTVLWNASLQSMTLSYEKIDLAAPSLGLKIRSIRVSGATDLEAAFDSMEKSRPQGVVILFGPQRSSDIPRIAEFVVRHRIPTMFEPGRGAESGGLMEFGADVVHMARGVGYFVDRIANGAHAAELPVEEPTKFELVVNLKAARAMGLVIPPTLLLRADRVIE